MSTLPRFIYGFLILLEVLVAFMTFPGYQGNYKITALNWFVFFSVLAVLILDLINFVEKKRIYAGISILLSLGIIGVSFTSFDYLDSIVIRPEITSVYTDSWGAIGFGLGTFAMFYVSHAMNLLFNLIGIVTIRGRNKTLTEDPKINSTNN